MPKAPIRTTARAAPSLGESRATWQTICSTIKTTIQTAEACSLRGWR